LKNLKKTTLSSPYFEFFAWISEVFSLDPLDKPQITKLHNEKRQISKFYTFHQPEEKKDLPLFYEMVTEERILKEMLTKIQVEKYANELLVCIAERIFQDLEEYFTYISSKENITVEAGGLEAVYQKLSLVFNSC